MRNMVTVQKQLHLLEIKGSSWYRKLVFIYLPSSLDYSLNLDLSELLDLSRLSRLIEILP